MAQSGIYGWTTGKGGVHFHRVAEPLRVAANLGTFAATGTRMDDEVAEQYDTILVHMLWQDEVSEAWEKLAANGTHRLVFDIDDAMWTPDWEPFQQHYTRTVLDRLWRNLALAHVVTTPSPFIAEHVARYNPNVWVVPNTVPDYCLALRPMPRDRRIVGYQGSASHDPDIGKGFLADLRQFVVDHPGWDLSFWGKSRDELAGWPTHRVHTHPWQASVRKYHESLAMDIGIGPLKRSPFNAGKSALRAIEYSALGIVPVLTDWDPYIGWVEDGVTGYLIGPGRTFHRWYDALHHLATHSGLRLSMSERARERATQWTTEASIGRWVEAWNSVG